MCFFLSPQSKRATKFVMSNAPGPGIYSLPSMLSSRKDFSRGLQGVFATPIAERVDKANGIPAPNNYNASVSMFRWPRPFHHNFGFYTFYLVNVGLNLKHLGCNSQNKGLFNSWCIRIKCLRGNQPNSKLGIGGGGKDPVS